MKGIETTGKKAYEHDVQIDLKFVRNILEKHLPADVWDKYGKDIAGYMTSEPLNLKIVTADDGSRLSVFYDTDSIETRVLRNCPRSPFLS